MRIKIPFLKNSKGATLLEALVALFLAGIVTTAIFNVYINQHKAWSIQEEIIDVQQNARAAIDELTRQIRMAGHGLPIQLDGIEAYNTNPDTIVINYADGDCEINIEQTMPNTSAELRCEGHDISCFHDDQWVYIFDPDSGGGEFFEISHVQVAAAHIQHNTMDLSTTYDSGAVLLSLQRIKYFIDYTDSLHPNLMMELPGQSPEVYAENITDLQFEYTMKNGMVVDAPAIASDVRQVSITLTGRTNTADIDFEGDPYRTREFTSSVNLRNLY
jgi:pilin/secretion family protein with methylation motif